MLTVSSASFCKPVLRSRGSRRLALTTSFALAAASVTPAWANDATGSRAPAANDVNSNANDEIIVTARRVNENLRDVPVAVSVISSSDLRQQQISRTEDLPRLAPGLTVADSPRGGSAPSYLIRGQRGAFNPSSLTDPAVAVYFGEASQSRSVGTNQGLFDLSSVQVLKGPQGTLFGRNSTGGAILITPQAPTEILEGYVQGAIGNFSDRDVEGVLNMPLGERAAIRGGIKYSKRDGYLINALDGRKANDLDALSSRLSLLLKPGEGITSTFVGTYYRSRGVGFATKLQTVDPAGVPASLGSLRPVVIGTLSAELSATQALGPYQIRALPNLHSNDEVWSIQNTTEIALSNGGLLGDATLKNIASYRDVTSNFFQDFAGSSAGLFNVTSDVNQHTFSDELQISGKTGRLSYVAGLYYSRETARESGIGQQFAMLSTLPPPLPLLFPSYVNFDLDVKSRSLAGYFHVDYKVSDTISLAGGVRLTEDRRSVVWHNINYSGLVPGNFVCALTGVAVAAYDRSLCAVPSGTLKSTEPTYDISLTFKANDDLTIYATHRRGYRSGSFNQSPFALVGNNRTFEPEFVKDIEVGLKSKFAVGGMTGRLNAAGYYQWYTNIQRTVFVQDPGDNARTASQIVNAASADIYGGEVELALQPVRNLDLRANYAYTLPKYNVWQDIYLSGTTPVLVDISDSDFGFVPRHQWSLSGTYTVPLGQLGEVALGLTWYGQSRQASADVFSQNCAGGSYAPCLNSTYSIPRYDLVNARLDWRNLAGSGLDAGIFVNNLTNKYYVNYATNLIGLLGTNSVGIGAPRMYGMELRISFGGK